MAEPASVLVVDDSRATLEVIGRILEAAGYTVLTAGASDEAISLLESATVDLVVTDLKMPGVSGLGVVRHVCQNFKDTEVMVVTGFATVESAVEAVKAGAEDYLSKPFTDEELLAAVGRALEARHRRLAARSVVKVPARAAYGLIGESEAMRGVLRTISKAAATPATVLVSGESGTGKELVARAIHYGSERASAPFVAVNCGAIPETLLESELFGYVKGAFTGATESRAGYFQTADGGTIFLDEISETSPTMQVKLLRVLQDKEISMVGATRSRRVDVRIVAATNREPLALVGKGVLREDLFYRLNVITIPIPPLRQRGDDILVLARHFATKYADDLGRPVPSFSGDALQALLQYSWPGNVRELENVVQQLMVMGEGETIEVFDLPSIMRFSALREAGPDRSLADVEYEHIRKVVAHCGGNRSKAARILGIDRKTLREKLRPKGSPRG